MKLALVFRNYLDSGQIRRGTNLQKIVDESFCVAEKRKSIELSGVPREDWIKVAQLLIASNVNIIKEAIQDATYLRLLKKGSLLSSKLGEIWKGTGSYEGATSVVHDALVQEHFSSALKRWKGVNVMTIHKAKGKEFDEVVIYEGFYNGRIVFSEADKDVAQARLKLRVAVTRARLRTTILTPCGKRCSLL